MAILNLRTLPDPILKKRSKEVGEVDSNLQKFMDDMLETMYSDNGIGLAAVQVGVLKQVVVIDIRDDNLANRYPDQAGDNNQNEEKSSEELSARQDSAKSDDSGDASYRSQTDSANRDADSAASAASADSKLASEDSETREMGPTHAEHCPLYLVNPKITRFSQEKDEMEEGCLSVPGEAVTVSRSTSITLEYLDYYGNPVEWDIEGLLARVVQHELDHTNGVTLLDYLSKLKKDNALKKLKRGKNKAA
jgi:peptide deformylase